MPRGANLRMPEYCANWRSFNANPNELFTRRRIAKMVRIARSEVPTIACVNSGDRVSTYDLLTNWKQDKLFIMLA